MTLAWCTAYNRWSEETWKTPVRYQGDVWAEMATAKAFATDGAPPILPKYPASLGAPFKANWNDHLTVEEAVFAVSGLCVRLFGLFVGSNIALLGAHLLAAAGFYIGSRGLRVNRPFSIAFGILFAMSHYALRRNLEHLVLTYYWHVPLGLLVVWWCLDRNPSVWTPRRILGAAAIAVAHGVQNPYYTNMFIQFLGIAALIALVRRRPWREVATPLLFGAIAFVSFAAMNFDTLFYLLSHGPNTQVTVRSYAGIEVYALKPVELFLPFTHRLQALQAWTHKAYFAQVLYLGERGSPYLGIVAIVGLVWLSWSGFKGLAQGNLAGIPRHLWLVLWIVLYSIIGGVNGLLGIFGMVLFRGANRFSIVIMALTLLFLAAELTRLSRQWRFLSVLGLAFILTLVGLLDQTEHPPTHSQIAAVNRAVAADGKLAAELEAKLPPGSMIFQLPVMGYPEVDPVHQMKDYEHFRPYLQTTSLRYSYGSDKGRARERWQAEAARFTAEGLIATLERYGFSALLLNKKAYPDGGAALLDSLHRAGRGNILAEAADLVCLSLTPASHPALPPEFDWHWHELEGTPEANLRWSDGSASVVLHNPESKGRVVRVIFTLGTAREQRVSISGPSGELYRNTLTPDAPSPVIDLPITLSGARTELRFETDRPGERPENGDPRKLAFNLGNFKIVE